jgi:hypothetical protein
MNCQTKPVSELSTFKKHANNKFFFSKNTRKLTFIKNKQECVCQFDDNFVNHLSYKDNNDI